MEGKRTLRKVKGSNPYIAMGLEPFLVVARDPDIRWRIVGTGSIEPPEFIPTQVSGRGFSVPCFALCISDLEGRVFKKCPLLKSV